MQKAADPMSNWNKDETRKKKTKLMQAVTIYFPKKLVVGSGTLYQLKDEVLQATAKKVLFVTIEPLLPQLEAIVRELKAASIDVQLDTSIVQEPYFSDFEKLMQNVSLFNPDVVIGIGGGSVLDVAKLVAAQLENKQSLRDYVGIGLLKGRKKTLICIPTTSGTGSEASPNAILVDDSDGQKKGIISPFLVPDVVILDPLLTLSVPPSITAATGIDALTHCLEAYTNKFAHPLIDLYAFKGMQLIAANIVQAVQNGNDEKARTEVALGSFYGGVCLGPVNTAAVHALSYPLGSLYHLPHGLSNALLLPYVMEFNLQASPSRYADVAVALGCERANDDATMAGKGVEKVKALIQQCGLPLRLREVGVKEETIPQMAADAMKIQRLLKNNPREVSEEDAVNIFKAAF
ncbi:iron-containing alcohol dehydrogenase [Flavisolibacter ginsenosidimutans]|nr:iron-containing alcohol dehydrogenase [Flavisolibacter ginsenosidimutans]